MFQTTHYIELNTSMDKTELQMKRERMLSSTYKKILVLYTHNGRCQESGDLELGPQK